MISNAPSLDLVEFIETTKREDMPTIEKIQPQLTDSEKRTKRSRIILITLITVGGLAALGLLAYVLWQVSLLLI